MRRIDEQQAALIPAVVGELGLTVSCHAGMVSGSANGTMIGVGWALLSVPENRTALSGWLLKLHRVWNSMNVWV
jgi:hypothetical protein